jgi:hypothetical protein
VTDPVIAAIEGLFLEPTLGIPILVTVWALLAWVLWPPPTSERRPGALRKSWFPPEADLPSRVYFALADGHYSRVLSALAQRLDDAVRSRYHLSLYRHPLTRWGPHRGGTPAATALRSVLRSISSLHARALERESRFYIRWRFWLPPEVDEEDFLHRVDGALNDAGWWIRELEATR